MKRGSRSELSRAVLFVVAVAASFLTATLMDGWRSSYLVIVAVLLATYGYTRRHQRDESDSGA